LKPGRGPLILLFNGHWRSFRRGEYSSREFNSPSSITEVKNEWSYTPAFSVYIHRMDKENSNFSL
jgi:hypothetical protein